MGQRHPKQQRSDTQQPPAYQGLKVDMDLQKFVLITQLGKGTFCKVFAAENIVTGQILALKYCYKETLQEKKAINHIIQERGLLEDFSHPFICNLRFSFQDSHYVYMALELMAGGDLRAYMSQPISESGCRIIIAEVCTALEYLHQSNIVHRDIKPDNILLDQQGHAYLTDFNVAVKFKPGQPLRSVAGTEPYMAPELFKTTNSGYYTSIDWWSLGVVMFEMIFANRPFRGKTKREDIIKGEYHMPTSKFSHISVNCRNFISNLLQVKIGKRLGCGLEGMTKYRNHNFFKAKRSPRPAKNVVSAAEKLPKVDKVVAGGVCPAASVGALPSTLASTPTNTRATSPSANENSLRKKDSTKLKPIDWKKLEKRLIEPVLKPDAPRTERPLWKKKDEKDVEAEKFKESEKEADLQHMLSYQRGEIPVSGNANQVYPSLNEKFLYYDHNFPQMRAKKEKKSSFVDVERIVRSCSSIISLSDSNSLYRKKSRGKSGGDGSQRSTSSALNDINQRVPRPLTFRQADASARPMSLVNLVALADLTANAVPTMPVFGGA